MLTKIIAIILAALSAIFSVFGISISKGEYCFEINCENTGKTVGNMVSTVNLWEMGKTFYDPQVNEEYGLDFVEYFQLMQATGGNYERDLFKDPYNTEVLDDYDFERLIKNCEGILSLGKKPWIKIGNVPMKYSKNARTAGMGCNLLPPDDYDVYYNYLVAIFQALVNEFGQDEVLKWRFTAFTEFENSDWFACETAEQSAEHTCKMYDYIVDALEKTVGEDVYIGAHAMAVIEGGWDEAIFIEHCANGTNYKTGKKGTRLCFLSASYYEDCPGVVGKRKTLAETINYLRTTALKYGLDNLDYGVDEGRVLNGTEKGSNEYSLVSRTVGYIWQAGFDANIYGLMLDNDIDWFSHWDYYSDGVLNGNPTLSYHISSLISRFKGSKLLNVNSAKTGYINNAVVKAYSAFDEKENTLRIMAYNYKNSLKYSESAKVKLDICAPQFSGETVNVTEYVIDDDCNYFDEWLEDREEYGIDSTCFSWSPQCPCIGCTLVDANAKSLYETKLRAKYSQYCRLTPKSYTLPIENGKISIDASIGANNVVFYEIG